MKERWGRMKQIFEFLDGSQLTVRQITDLLEQSDDIITLNLVDSLLRHYHKNGYLKRKKEPISRKFAYILSNKGKKQLIWLKERKYLNY